MSFLISSKFLPPERPKYKRLQPTQQHQYSKHPQRDEITGPHHILSRAAKQMRLLGFQKYVYDILWLFMYLFMFNIV